MARTVPYEDYIQAASKRHDVSPALLKGLIEQESNFQQTDKRGRPLTPGTSTAVGLTQMIPYWNPEYDPHLLANDPEYNIHAGAHKMSGLINRADPNLSQEEKERWALGRYYGSKDPNANRNYINSVMGKKGSYEGEVEEEPLEMTPELEAEFQARFEQEQQPLEMTPELEAEFKARFAAENPDQKPPGQPPEQPEQQGRFGAALGRGIDALKEAGQGISLGVSSALGDEEAAKEKFAAAKEADIAQQNAPGPKSTTFQDIQDKAAKEGWWEASKELPGYAAEKITESAPSTALPLLAGAAAGAISAPIAIPVGVATAIWQQFGSMIDRQVAEKTAAGELSPEKAALAAIPAGALDFFTDKFTLGMNLGAPAKAALKEQALAKIEQSILSRVTGKVAKGALLEAPTEIAQTELERGQAGLSLTDEQAQAEMKESGISAGISGGVTSGVVGVPAAISEKKQAEEHVDVMGDRAQDIIDAKAELTPEEFRDYGPALSLGLVRRWANSPEAVTRQQAMERLREKVGVPVEPEAEVTTPEAEVTTPEAETVTPEEQGVAQKQQTVEPDERLAHAEDTINKVVTNEIPYESSEVITAAKNLDVFDTAYTPIQQAQAVQDKIREIKATPAVEPKSQTTKEQGVAQKQQTVEAVKPTEEQDTTGLASGFTEMLGDMSESYYKQAFESLQQGKTTISGVKDPILTRAKEAFDKGLIQHPEDIKNFEQNGYPKTTKEQIVQPETDQTFSVAPTEKSTPYTAELLKRSLTPEMRRLVDSGKAVLHDTQDTLPGTNHPANVQGMTTPEGITHYVANKLNPTTIQNVALHEVGVHTGMKNMVGDKVWEDVKNQAMTNQGPEFDAARASIPKDTPAHLHAEETLAYLVENSSHLPFIRRLIAAVRNWARTTFGANLRLSQDDARHLATRALRKESQSKKTTARKEGTAFSAEKPAEEQPVRYSISPEENRQNTFQKEVGSWRKRIDTASDSVRSSLLHIFSAAGVYDIAGEKMLPGGHDVLTLVRKLSGKRDIRLNEYIVIRKEINAFLKKNHGKAGLLGDVANEATLLGASPAVDGNIDKLIADLKKKQPKGFVETVKRLNQLQTNWRRLGEPSQKIYSKLANYYAKSHADYLAAQKKAITDSGLSAAEQKRQLDLLNEKFADTKVKGDYFPISRFGKFGVAYRDGEVDPTTNKEINKFTKFDTSAEAKKFLENPKIEGDIIKDIDRGQQVMVGDSKSLQELYAELDKNFKGDPKEAQAEMKDFVFQMYLMGKPEQSMAKRFLHRKGTAGYSNDIFRGFDNYAMSMARQLPRVELGREITNKMKAMEHNIPRGDITASDYYSAFNREIDSALHPKIVGPIANFATGAAFSYYLTSPASAALQLASVPIQGLPSIAKRHGYMLAQASLNAATNLYVKSGVGGKNGWWSIQRGIEKHKDINSLVKGATHADQFDPLGATKTFTEQGLITSGMHAQAFSGKNKPTGAHKDLMDNVVNLMDTMSQPFAQMETASRQIVAMAHYIANIKSGMTNDDAVKATIDSVYMDMGDFGSTGRAELTKSDFARVVWQFQQYGAKMLYAMGRSALNLTKKGQRKEAITHLSGLMAMHWIFAGALGLPAAGMIGAASDMLRDLLDDEEWHNYKANLRTYMNAKGINETMINIILDGPMSELTGLKLSERLGAHELLPIVKESQMNDSLKVSAKDRMVDMLGAAPSLILNVGDGLTAFTEGEYSKAVEKLVPNAMLKNMLMAARYEREGKLNKRGEEVIGKEEFTPYDIAAKAFGVEPYRPAQKEEAARRAKTDVEFVKALREDLLNEFRKEQEEGDTSKVLDKIASFNQKYPWEGIKTKNILSSLKTAARNKALNVRGFSYGKMQGELERRYPEMMKEEPEEEEDLEEDIPEEDIPEETEE
jgi:hypothetical protein